MQIFADDDGTKAVWIADLLPNELAGAITGMMDQGPGAMKKNAGTIGVRSSRLKSRNPAHQTWSAGAL